MISDPSSFVVHCDDSALSVLNLNVMDGSYVFDSRLYTTDCIANSQVELGIESCCNYCFRMLSSANPLEKENWSCSYDYDQCWSLYSRLVDHLVQEIRAVSYCH